MHIFVLNLVFFVCSCSAKLVIRWVDITQLEKNATLLFPDMIKVSTRSSEHFFSVFLNISETFKLMEQLANIAMRQLLDNEGFEQDRSLPKLKKKSPKKVSALKRQVALALTHLFLLSPFICRILCKTFLMLRHLLLPQKE